jgi:hypothetical protein
MRRAAILLLLACSSFFAFAPAAFAAKRVAFVVGIDKYDNLPAQQQLRKALSDAHAVGETLKGLGYDVIEANNVARLEFLRQWQQFLNRIEPGDEAAFFFAGHGVEIDGLNFLLPRDVPNIASGEEEVLKASGLSLGSVLEQVRERKPQIGLYIIDACRDNPFSDGKGRSIGATRGLARVEPPSGTFIMFSAGAKESALDRLSDNDKDPNSVYTRALLPKLRASGKSLTDIARDVRRDVREIAQTVNHVQTPAYYDEVVGEFCPAGCQAVAAADPVVTQPEPARPAAPSPAAALTAKPAEPPVPEAAAEREIPPAQPEENNNDVAALAPAQISPSAVSSLSAEPIQEIDSPDVIWCVAVSPDGALVATGDHAFNVKLWDVATGKLIKTLGAHSGDVNAIAFSSDGALLATAGEDHNVGVWDVKTGMLKRSLKGHAEPVLSVAFSPDGTEIASGSNDSTIRLWRTSDGKFLRSFTGQSYSVSAVFFSPDGRRLASAGWADGVTLWDVATAAKLSAFSTASGDYVDKLAFSPNWQTAATATDNLVKIWDVTQLVRIRTLEHGSEDVDEVQYSPDGTLVAAVNNKALRLWDVASGALRLDVKDPIYVVTSFVFSPDGSMLVVVGGTIKFYALSGSATAKR